MSTLPPTQLPHKFSYIIAILIHNHFESPNRYRYKEIRKCIKKIEMLRLTATAT
jgi:hypothetical protein